MTLRTETADAKGDGIITELCSQGILTLSDRDTQLSADLRSQAENTICRQLQMCCCETQIKQSSAILVTETEEKLKVCLRPRWSE